MAAYWDNVLLHRFDSGMDVRTFCIDRSPVAYDYKLSVDVSANVDAKGRAGFGAFADFESYYRTNCMRAVDMVTRLTYVAIAGAVVQLWAVFLICVPIGIVKAANAIQIE